MKNFWQRIGLPILLLAIVAAMFWLGLRGGFLFDDYAAIVENRNVQVSLDTWAHWKQAATAFEPGGRYLAMLSFAANYQFSGMDVWWFKFTNLAIHLLNTFLIWRLCVFLCARFSLPRAAPFVIALLWACHPIQVSAVLYVVQRMELLGHSFVFAALLMYICGRCRQENGRQGGWFWVLASGVVAATGFLSKETPALFPLYALLLEGTIFGFRARDARTQRVLRIAFAVGTSLAILIFVFWAIPRYAHAPEYAYRNFDAWQRILTQLRVLPMYLGQIFWPAPSHLTFYYDNILPSQGLWQPWTTWAGGLLLLGLAALAIAMRKCRPAIAFGIGLFFACHFLTSNVVALELAFEHRNYFALLGVLIATAAIVVPVLRKMDPRMGGVVVAAIAAMILFTAELRIALWGNALAMSNTMVVDNPTSPRAAYDLSIDYLLMADGDAKSPMFGIASNMLERAGKLPNSSPLPEHGLIVIYARNHLPVKDEWWDRLMHKLATRPYGPSEQEAVQILYTVDLNDDADLSHPRLKAMFELLIRRFPDLAKLRLQYADFAKLGLHDDALAVEQMRRAAQLDRDPKRLEVLINQLAQQKRTSEAEAVLSTLDLEKQEKTTP